MSFQKKPLVRMMLGLVAAAIVAGTAWAAEGSPQREGDPALLAMIPKIDG